MNASSINRANAKRQRGVTMVEVLVTLLVVAIGLLGLAALQSIAINSAQQAYHRSQAIALSSEVADWMRAHRSGVAGTDGRVPRLASWEALAAQRLPSGELAVGDFAINAGNGQISATITISWADGRGVDAQAIETLQIRTNF